MDKRRITLDKKRKVANVKSSSNSAVKTSNNSVTQERDELPVIFYVELILYSYSLPDEDRYLVIF